MDQISCSDSDEVEIMMYENCQEIEDARLEAESVEEQCNVNGEEGVKLEGIVNVEDGVSMDDGVNVISSLSSDSLEPFIGMIFDDVEDALAFYKAYVRRKYFAI